MGSKLTLCTTDGGMWHGTVVAKLWGHGGSADLVGIIVEDPDDKARATLEWPLTHFDGTTCGIPCSPPHGAKT